MFIAPESYQKSPSLRRAKPVFEKRYFEGSHIPPLTGRRKLLGARVYKHLAPGGAKRARNPLVGSCDADGSWQAKT